MTRAKGYILDTQILIWFFANTLPPKVLSTLINPETLVYVSVASVWEMIIKSGKGKLRIPRNIETAIKESGFKVLSINLSHILKLKNLQNFHKDPFDRILVAQSMTENLTLVSSDKQIFKYKVKVLKVNF